MSSLLSAEKIVHHVMLLSAQSWERIVIRFSAIVSKMSKTRVHDVVTINKIKFEPYGDYVNQVYSKFDETLINNQDPHGEIEDDEIPRAEYSNGNDLEETETKLLQFSTSCQQY